ncbi:hypothetical protein C1752_10576 [Acaryochloris thomasi RCC1774]|uniref:Uncharacterized protein n=1 Tax=Acaryochloris thomasi RCC1774 TaxID=1764569 RepID=A0A2W1J811_9CYAN|nr:hypothetical protein C1752_10576 [Acaryochloris thomasi RCC1774]
MHESGYRVASVLEHEINRRCEEARLQILLRRLKFSSSLFVVIGGILLASNIASSKYGFLLLAMSSSQLVLASFLDKDKSLLVYSLSLFLCVDCLGVYRWILN